MDEERELGSRDALERRYAREPLVSYATIHDDEIPQLRKTGRKPRAAKTQTTANDLTEWREGMDGLLPDSAGDSLGSNWWVVSGKRSRSGKPLLANDPHLEMAVPSFWYQAEIACPDAGLHAVGVGAPGVPAIVCGRNERMAWGVTACYFDSFDIYEEKLDAADCGYVVRAHGREKIVTERPTVRVRVGAVNVPIFWQPIRSTSHGFLVSEDRRRNAALAIRWAGTEVVESDLSILLLPWKRNCDEFRAALAGHFAPTLNFVFADVDGHIGYQAAGWVPKRPRGRRLTSVPGWEESSEWHGRIPQEEMPGVADPPSGFLVNANNAPTDLERYPSYYGEPLFGHYRATRIDELLRTREKVDLADMREMQADAYALQARVLLPALFAAVEREGESSEELRDALGALARWDGVARRKAVASAVYRAWVRTLESELRAEGMDGFLHSWLTGQDAPMLPGTERVTATGALVHALAALEKRFGPPPWTWEKVHRLELRHELGDRDGRFRLPTYGMDGDTETISVGPSHLPESPFVHAASSHRMLADLADPVSLWMVLPPGNSGNLASPHSVDQLGAWLAHAHYRLELTGAE